MLSIQEYFEATLSAENKEWCVCYNEVDWIGPTSRKGHSSVAFDSST